MGGVKKRAKKKAPAGPAPLEARMLETQRKFPHLKAPALRAGLGTAMNLDADEFALKLFLATRRRLE